MKILITTQSVDSKDPVLGFFVEWIESFAKEVESIEVICLRVGTHNLPNNVRIHSLGKEKKSYSRLTYTLRFLRLIVRLRHSYDSVFVHMNPEYVVLGGTFWRLSGKRIVLWYTHKHVDLKLKIAVRFANKILTASRESFRLPTRKLQIMGHGIATNIFTPQGTLPEATRLVTIGRISQAKGLQMLVDAMSLLPQKFELDIFGGPVSKDDEIYEKQLKEEIKEKKLPIRFFGPKEHAELPSLIKQYGLFLHASTGTGSMDKAVLEALSAGVPVISISSAFASLLSPYGLAVSTAPEMAQTVEQYGSLDQEKRLQIRNEPRDVIVTHHSLSSLVPRILATLSP